MADLICEEYDKFAVAYDILALMREGATKHAIESAVRLSPSAISAFLSLMLEQGLVKSRDGGGFKITALGSDFIDDFKGMRHFVQ